MLLGHLTSLLTLTAVLGSAGGAGTQTGGDRVVLTWTAVGDDGRTGNASLYDIRYSKKPITEANWFSATRWTVFRPHAPGTIERIEVSYLDPRSDYYFAIRTFDFDGNLSHISNVAVRRARGIGIEGMTEPLTMSSPWPNPARYATHFSLRVAEPGPLRVEVFDLSGRRVRTLASGDYSSGPMEMNWDLLAEGSRPVNAGMYLIRAQAGGISRTQRLTITR